MPDKKKVIKGLNHCFHGQEFCDEIECPYYIEQNSCYLEVCQKNLKEDVLALLKEQTTGHWIFLTDCLNSGVYCSECNTKVFDSYPFKKKLSYFCPHCGTRMEGEIERR